MVPEEALPCYERMTAKLRKRVSQAAKGSSFEAGLQAVQIRAEQQVAALAGVIKAAIQEEQAARQKRHTFTLQAVSDMGEQLALSASRRIAKSVITFDFGDCNFSEANTVRM